MDFTEKERMNETMKKQNNLKRAIVVFLILVTCISMMSVTASAATSGSTNSRTIYVRTTANWSRPGSESITLRQNKCKYSYQKMSWFRWVTKTASMYPNYTIKIKNMDTNRVTTKNWSSSSIKLNLDRNTNYQITVSYNSMTTWLSSNSRFSTGSIPLTGGSAAPVKQAAGDLPPLPFLIVPRRPAVNQPGV